MLARLGVFVDGCTLETIEGVCRGGKPGEGAAELLDDLGALIDGSLVRYAERMQGVEAGAARFALLEMTREYALEHLSEVDKAETRTLHARHFLSLAELAETRLRGPEQAQWLERLEADLENLRAALSWLFEQGDAEGALRLAAAMWRFCDLRGHLRDGRQWLEAALAATGPVGEYPGRQKLRAKAFNGLGNLALDQGDVDSARRACDQSLAVASAENDGLGKAAALHTLGLIAQSAGDLAAAERYHEESRALSAALGDRVGIYISLYNLAEVTRSRGDGARAAALHEKSLTLKRAQGDTSSIAWSLAAIGNLAARAGEYDRAGALHREGLRLRRSLVDQQGMAESMIGVAIVAAHRGKPASAVRLLGAASALLDQIGAGLSPHARGRLYGSMLEMVHEQLDDAAFERAWTTGYAMTLDQAVATALDTALAAAGHIDAAVGAI